MTLHSQPLPIDANSARANTAHLMWAFDPSLGLDRPFHDLISKFGGEVVLDLDMTVLDPPLRAAARATRVFQQYSVRIGRDSETREVMTKIASALKPNAMLLDSAALLPPEAVFAGFGRPETT